MEGQGPAPDGVDVATPNVARLYDFLLGGKDNHAVDRDAAHRLLDAVPDLRSVVRANRGFVGRAVRFAAETGIRQFIDLGAGLPTQHNVHEAALTAAPGARVVYVDYDPVVVSHGEALLAKAGEVAVVQGDLRRPGEVLAHPDLRALIDLDEPVAVLITCVLHFLPDGEDPLGAVARIRREIAPGSHLALTHGTGENRTEEARRAVVAVYEGASSPMVSRTRAEILRFLDGFSLLDPGLVHAAEWRPVVAGTDRTAEAPEARETRETDTILLAAMARKDPPVGGDV